MKHRRNHRTGPQDTFTGEITGHFVARRRSSSPVKTQEPLKNTGESQDVSSSIFLQGNKT